jgi:hypothetical protein
MQSEFDSSKTRFLKIQSSTDRSEGTLNAFSVDLGEYTPLQRCVGVQLINCGFTPLSHNVDEFSNVLILNTNFGTTTLTVPDDTYSITTLLAELDSQTGDFSFAFVDDKVEITSPIVFRVVDVLKDRNSTLAPLLGYQGDEPDALLMQRADTSPGLVGIKQAFLHIRPVANRNSVTISRSTAKAIGVSILGQIPIGARGDYTSFDFSGAGTSYYLDFGDERDLTQLRIRLRDFSGNLIPISNPGVQLSLKIFLR